MIYSRSRAVRMQTDGREIKAHSTNSGVGGFMNVPFKSWRGVLPDILVAVWSSSLSVRCACRSSR